MENLSVSLLIAPVPARATTSARSGMAPQNTVEADIPRGTWTYPIGKEPGPIPTTVTCPRMAAAETARERLSSVPTMSSTRSAPRPAGRFPDGGGRVLIGREGVMGALAAGRFQPAGGDVHADDLGGRQRPEDLHGQRTQTSDPDDHRRRAGTEPVELLLDGVVGGQTGVGEGSGLHRVEAGGQGHQVSRDWGARKNSAMPPSRPRPGLPGPSATTCAAFSQ